MKKKICIVTGARADYGLLCWVMKEIKKRDGLELIPVATGVHLSKESGYTVSEVIEDGFDNVKKIEILDGDTSPCGIGKAIGRGVDKFSEFFKNEEIDLLLLLGDRFEMLAVAMAALPFNIPIGHIGGGEISEGVIDDSIRHSLTKLSHLHYPITEKCADRIRQMGEEPWRVNVVGSPRMDYMTHVDFKPKEQLNRELGIDFTGKTVLAVYHPVTLEYKDTENHIDNYLKALDVLNIETVMLYPNIDTYGEIIIQKIEEFASNRSKIKLFKPLKMIDYLSIINAVDIVIGNSSSGIVEAPSFKLPAVNIGNRQKGRDQVRNVINVGYSCEEIVKGAEKGLCDKEFIKSLEGLVNPYGDGKASKRLVDLIEGIDLENFSIMKKNCFN